MRAMHRRDFIKIVTAAAVAGKVPSIDSALPAFVPGQAVTCEAIDGAISYKVSPIVFDSVLLDVPCHAPYLMLEKDLHT